MGLTRSLSLGIPDRVQLWSGLSFLSSNLFFVAENTMNVTPIMVSTSGCEFSILAENDGDKFAIDSTGLLSFLAAPDFEIPIDTNADNVYNLTVRATKNGTHKDQSIMIVITPVSEFELLTATSLLTATAFN